MRWFQKVCSHYVSGFFSRSFEHFSLKLGVYHFWGHTCARVFCWRFRNSTPHIKQRQRRQISPIRFGGADAWTIGEVLTRNPYFSLQDPSIALHQWAPRARIKYYLFFVLRRKVWKYLPPMESTWHSSHFEM